MTARKFRDLNIEPSAREIELLEPVEALARYGDADDPPSSIAGMIEAPAEESDDPSQIAAE